MRHINDRLVDEKALARVVAGLYQAGDERSARKAANGTFRAFGVSAALKDRVLRAASNFSYGPVYRPARAKRTKGSRTR
jgi:hypothetical protein